MRLPGCGSAWKSPSIEHHLHVQLDERRHHARHVHSRGVEPVDARALHELHHEHALTRELADRLFGTMTFAVPREVRADLDARARPRAGSPSPRAMRSSNSLSTTRTRFTCGWSHQRSTQREIRRAAARSLRHRALDVRAQHLHRDDLALVARAVHLAERRRGDGHALERVE